MSGTLLVIAGEASGDLHGAELLREIKARRPDLRIIGIGGDGMAPHLDRQLAHVKDLGVVGFIEVIKHLPTLNRLFKQILQAAREEKIEAALFIDYPGLNLRLAKSLRASMPPVKLHQYVCPQVWAWKKGRIPELGRILDTLYCLFDFEPDLFKGLPVEAIWVGNPLVETVKPEGDREAFFSSTSLDPLKPLVALLPGSREGEIQRLLPPMAELARRWRGDSNHRDVQWVLPVAPTLSDEFIQPFLKGTPILPLRFFSYAARAYANAALVASGTATLETALLGTPFAIVYKLNPLTYAMAKAFVKLPYFGLANVVAGRAVVEELVQNQVNPDELSKVLTHLLDPATAAKIREDLGTVRPHLGKPGAAGRVAGHLLCSMENS